MNSGSPETVCSIAQHRDRGYRVLVIRYDREKIQSAPTLMFSAKGVVGVPALAGSEDQTTVRTRYFTQGGAMGPDRPMYRWREMTPQQRNATLEYRQRHRVPWHGPPHYVGDSGLYLITAACYEHYPIIGVTPERMAEFESELLQTTQAHSQAMFAWNVLPNHYHLLLHASEIRALLQSLGKLHGRTSFRWNGEEGYRGRQVWHRAAETEIKSERHFFATLNYVLHNAVRHGYVDRWQDWPYSNAAQYLAEVGGAEAERRWRDYPVLDYGKDWDPPEL